MKCSICNEECKGVDSFIDSLPIEEGNELVKDNVYKCPKCGCYYAEYLPYKEEIKQGGRWSNNENIRGKNKS